MHGTTTIRLLPVRFSRYATSCCVHACVHMHAGVAAVGSARTSREGSRRATQASRSPCLTSYRGEMTPHLFSLRA